MQKKDMIFKNFRGCLVLTVLLLCGCGRESDLVIETADEVVAQQSAEAETPSVVKGSAEAEMTVPDVVYVQVTGAVHSPGVYELPVGSRVFEAVQKAGGMTDEAAAESLNQALEVSDGQMIVLYTQQEWKQMQEGGSGATDDIAGEREPEDGRVNINTASPEELCTIPGIGQSRAQSIITYREQNGAFGSIEEIMNVSGIKDGLFQKIKDKIKV